MAGLVLAQHGHVDPHNKALIVDKGAATAAGLHVGVVLDVQDFAISRPVKCSHGTRAQGSRRIGLKVPKTADGSHGKTNRNDRLGFMG